MSLDKSSLDLTRDQFSDEGTISEELSEGYDDFADPRIEDEDWEMAERGKHPPSFPPPLSGFSCSHCFEP